MSRSSFHPEHAGARRDREPNKVQQRQSPKLGDVFRDALSKVEPSTGEHMQDESFWRDVWRK